MKPSILLLALVATLSACGDHPQPQAQVVPPQQPNGAQYQQAPQVVQVPGQPVIVQQHDNGMGTALAAGALGYMIGNSGNRQAAAPSYSPPVTNTIVREKVIIKEKLVPAPVAVAPVAPKAPVTLAPIVPAPKPVTVAAAPAPVYKSAPVAVVQPPKATYAATPTYKAPAASTYTYKSSSSSSSYKSSSSSKK